ncbi:MAG: aldo/keto reductase [Bacteroidota bacterium]
MDKRKIKNSDLFITPVAFGAWAIGGFMWGGAERSDALEAINTAIDNGMTTIDTAPVYGMGASELLVGEAIKGKRDQVEILTKCGLRWDEKEREFFFSTDDPRGKSIDIYKNGTKKSIIRECEDSLRRLGTDYIDLYQLHWPTPSDPIEETMEAFNVLIKQGKIRYAAVCNFDAEQLSEAMQFTPLISDQVPYSMVKRDIEDDVVPFCRANELGIFAYSPMQRGLLTGKFSPDHEFSKGDSRADAPHFKPENIKKTNAFLDEIKEIAKSKNITLAQLVLRWTMVQPGISCVLAGARNAEQVAENIGAANFNLEKDEIETINSKLDNLSLDL